MNFTLLRAEYGGHLTTNEQPEALAALIADFEGSLSGMPRRS
jgi:hypothetical protein